MNIEEIISSQKEQMRVYGEQLRDHIRSFRNKIKSKRKDEQPHKLLNPRNLIKRYDELRELLALHDMYFQSTLSLNGCGYQSKSPNGTSYCSFPDMKSMPISCPMYSRKTVKVTEINADGACQVKKRACERLFEHVNEDAELYILKMRAWLSNEYAKGGNFAQSEKSVSQLISSIESKQISEDTPQDLINALQNAYLLKAHNLENLGRSEEAELCYRRVKTLEVYKQPEV